MNQSSWNVTGGLGMEASFENPPSPSSMDQATGLV